MNTNTLRTTVTALLALAAFTGCQSTPEDEGMERAAAVTPDAHVVEVVAEDYAFEAPDEIRSGWTTFRLDNVGEETHFLYLSRLPEERTYDEYLSEVGQPINEIWYKIRSGELDKEAALERLGPAIPAWYFESVEVLGGPGMVAPGGVSRVTVNLEPGRYVMECFMKTPEGEFHWVEGMIRPFTVRAESSEAPEPTADARLTLTTEGYVLDRDLEPGVNTVEVVFAEQPEAGFGNDVHVARLEEGMEAEALVPWMDAFNLEGLQSPAPVVFVGGTHERPAGERIYFTVDLEEGRYALLSEASEARRMAQEITVD